MDQENLAPLIEFIGKKFDQVDQRFEAIDRRLDQVATKEEVRAEQAETRRHFEVIAEGLRADIRQVAEGHQFLVDGQARTIERIAQLERELGAMIRFSYVQIERRIQELEGNYAALNERVGRLESSRV